MSITVSLLEDVKGRIAVDFIVHKEMEAEFLRYTKEHTLMKAYQRYKERN